jgi:hypothetical protein
MNTGRNNKTTVLNNFRTLLLLCADMRERQKLLKDFIIAYHPDKFSEGMHSYYTNLILEATDIFNRAPLTFGHGRPSRVHSKKAAHKAADSATAASAPFDFFYRCEAYAYINKAKLYHNHSQQKKSLLSKAGELCAAFFTIFQKSAYLGEMYQLHKQIEYVKAG